MAFALLTPFKMLQYVADLINQMADMGPFNSKSESARSPSAKHVMDAVKLQLVLSTPAGFEKNTKVYINTVSPEAAASYLKE